MKQKSYFYWLTEKVRLRVRLSIEAGKVLDFTVQLEAVHNGEWKAVVRYNYAHGKPHKDIINSEGRLIKKVWLNQMTLAKVVVAAQKDLIENWLKYLGELGFEEA